MVLTLSQIFKSANEDLNYKLDIIRVTLLNTYSTIINNIADIKLHLKNCDIN